MSLPDRLKRSRRKQNPLVQRKQQRYHRNFRNEIASGRFLLQKRRWCLPTSLRAARPNIRPPTLLRQMPHEISFVHYTSQVMTLKVFLLSLKCAAEALRSTEEVSCTDDGR